MFSEVDARHSLDNELTAQDEYLANLKKKERDLNELVIINESKIMKLEDTKVKHKFNTQDYTELTKEYSDLILSKEKNDAYLSKSLEKNDSIVKQIEELKDIYNSIKDQ